MLRTDLKIVRRPDQDGCLIIDETSGKEYEFGEVERCLLEGLHEGKSLEGLCAVCNERFGLHYTVDDIGEFIRLLREWGLLKVSPAPTPAAGAPEAPATSDHAADGRSQNPDGQQRRWHLFNPQQALDTLRRGLYPLRFLVWTTPLIFVAGAIYAIARRDAFMADWALASLRFGLLGRLALDILSVSVLAQFARGLMARHFGLATPSFGIVLLFGLIPRFDVQLASQADLDRRARLWLYATATLVRLWLFGGAVMLWALTRAGGRTLPVVGVELAIICLIGLLFCANPLWRGDAMMFLSALLEIPNIQRRANNSLWSFFIRRPAVISRHARHTLSLGIFGLVSTALLAVVFGHIGFLVFSYLELHYQGAGVALFLLLGGYISLALKRQFARTRPVKARVKNENRHGRGLRVASVVILLACLLLPYRYETGGETEIMPAVRVTISPEMDGVIEEVFFNGGEMVKAGTVLARLADYRQLNDLRILEADIAGKQNEILRYQTTPSSAEIALAEAKVNTARTQAAYSEDMLKRQKPLLERKFVSEQAYADLQSKFDRDRQLLAEALSNLTAVKAQVNPYQIAQLRDELEKLKRKADYDRELLKHTQLIAPVDGRIVTSDLQYRRNSYSDAGKTFAEIETSQTVVVRVAIPEFDIGDVSLQAPVRIKLWSFPRHEFVGVIDEIEPASKETTTAAEMRVVYVKSRLENKDGQLRSGLTGFAKVEGEETIVLFAFTRALIRFVVVEAWSWLP